MNKRLLITGSILGFLGVVIGAFGAHGLEKLVDADAIATFETAVKYQIYHALLMLLVASFALSEKTKKVLHILILVGVILFSGSIYGLATNVLTGFDFTTIGFVTPIGGALLITAWGVLIVKFFQMKK
ncbi:DUF423 domain-containing protein [uncultured Dokdonia sp.]|uniref:DUF423 domain-containing protein n=1 Tax=uncultured Dokdonia sp. TaxID=575653 RepID=UPI0026164DBB|nr:DUF423 domain-containing protein [uncultured Dokdonia sp.]